MKMDSEHTAGTGKLDRSSICSDQEHTHRMSCLYWSNPVTRRQLGLPTNEAMKRFIVATQAPSTPATGPGRGMGITAMAVQQEQKRTFAQKRAETDELVRTDLNRLLSLVCQHVDTTPALILSRSRQGPTKWARQLVMALAHLELGYSFPALGRYFNRDHSTIVYGLAAVKEQVAVATRAALTMAALQVAVRQMFNLQPQPTPAAATSQS